MRKRQQSDILARVLFSRYIERKTLHLIEQFKNMYTLSRARDRERTKKQETHVALAHAFCTMFPRIKRLFADIPRTSAEIFSRVENSGRKAFPKSNVQKSIF